MTFVVHLMQGGRLSVDAKQAARPRGGQARFVFDGDVPALLLTEQGTERKAGVWCVASEVGVDVAAARPSSDRRPTSSSRTSWRRCSPPGRCACTGSSATSARSPASVGASPTRCATGRKLSPFAMTGKLGEDAAAEVVKAIRDAVAEGLEYERGRDDMSSSKDRPGRVHGRTGEPCPVCGDTIRAVEYSGYTVNYCPTCQTGGKVLADNTTSKFLK